MADHSVHPDPAPCCAPSRGPASAPQGSLHLTDLSAAASARHTEHTPDHSIDQCLIPTTTFAMGDAHGDGLPADGERPVHSVTVESFSIDATSVTNEAFARFIAATGYRTEAEVFGDSAVFHLAVKAAPQDILGQPPQFPWWVSVRGADWAHPGGPLSNLDGLGDHPVTHVSWNDAVAYCEWANRRLPTEAEWECASRGGLEGARYPWGDQVVGATGAWRCNIWQGTFPTVNTLDDGWLTTAPVHTYEPNGYGLWQTVGNVWEWCADYFDPLAYSADDSPHPRGPETGQTRSLRGGSYLCHDSYCNRYRNAARSSNSPDSTMGNAGFRTVDFAA